MWGKLIPESKLVLPVPDKALQGRTAAMVLTGLHAVSGRSIFPPFPPGVRSIAFGMGCFWGAERLFWSLSGVWVTSVGYGGGYTPNPTYKEVCSGQTGHTELVLVAFRERQPFAELLKIFWESHDPTQKMRQGNDVGTQYRSMILVHEHAMLAEAEESRSAYQLALSKAGRGTITTEISWEKGYYYAEEEHQQYLDKHPNGYCGLAGTGVCMS